MVSGLMCNGNESLDHIVREGVIKPVSRLRRMLQWICMALQFPYFWRAAKRIDSDGFDGQHGTDTAPLMQTRAPLGFLVNRYETTAESAIESAIESLGIDLSPYTFLDLGCGKGKPLIIAARYPFHRIIGLDISVPCLTIARKNVERCGLTGRIDLVAGDAAAYDFPPGHLLVYLFNPFPARILGLVIDRLVERQRSSPGPVAVVYINPKHAKVVERSGIFRRVAEVPGIGSPYERALGYVSVD